MSKRRRNSRRRKSSCNSKQSVCQYSLPVKNALDNVVQEDNTAEKGETDSFCKENILLDDEEKEMEPTEKNRIFRHRCHTDVYNSDEKEAQATVQGDTEKEPRISHSLTIHDLEKSVPKIVIQRTGKKANIEVAVNTSNSMSSSITLEIREVELSEDTYVRTIFVFQNKKEKESEACNESSSHRYSFGQCRKECKQHHNHCENQMCKVNLTERKDSESNLSFPSSQEDRDCCKSCCKDHSKHCDGEHMDTDFTLVDGSSVCSSPFGEITISNSLSNEILWDIPVPLEFADQETSVFQDLTENIELCHIGDSYVFKQQQDFQHGPGLDDPLWNLGSSKQLTVDKLKRTSKLAYCNTPLNPDPHKYDLDTKNIFCKSSENHQGNMHGKNNCSLTNCREVLIKRRRTFPDTTFQSDQESENILCKGAFSSGTLAFQDVLAARSYPEDDILCLLQDGSCKFSSSSPLILSSVCGASIINEHNSLTSDKTSDAVFYKVGHTQVQPEEFAELLHEDRVKCNSTAGPVKNNEVTEIGVDEEKVETEDYSEKVHTEDTQRNLLIHVTPPSPFKSFENKSDPQRVPQNTNIQTSNLQLGTQKNRRCSVVTIIKEEYEQRVLHGNFSGKNLVQKHHSIADTQTSNTLVVSASKECGVQKQDANMDASPQDDQKPLNMICCQKERCLHKKTLVVNQTGSADGQTNAKSSAESTEHLRPPGDCITKASKENSDHWAKKRKLFKESRQYGSAEESSMTSNITDESDTMNSEDNRSVDVSLRDIEDRGFYTETFHSASWIYRGDDVSSNKAAPCLTNHPRPVAVRERTVKISKGVGEYPWGFRIQFSKPIIVTEVDTNGAAEEAGLNIGDYVLAVNSTDVTSVPHSEAVDLARQGPDLLTLTIGSDISRSPNTPGPACRGYLHKRTQSSLLKGWRKRWFVLKHDCCLYYYRNRRDEGKRPALAAMRLEGALVGVDTSLGKPFVFKCSPVGGNRVYYFCATSNQEMRRWLEAMECAVQPINQHHVWVDVTRHNSNLPPLAVKNPECLGLLNLLDRNKDSWVQRYCILKDGCLYFYNSIRSAYALGGIYLHGYTVREQLLGFKRSIIELKPPSEEFSVFHLCAENGSENKRWIGAIKASIGKWLPFHKALQDYINHPPEETKM